MRPNGEIEITFEAIHKAFNLPETVTIAGYSGGIKDSLRGIVRLCVIDECGPELREGQMPPVIDLITSTDDGDDISGMQSWHDGRYITARGFRDADE